jgi:DNA gyrase/topoisomerase IV subunit A
MWKVLMKTVDASTLVEDCYVDYASYVNGYRSIPDSRDGLKVVQRRILSTILKSSAGKIPSPAIVGDCNKWFHPHGESSIYGALVSMVNADQALINGHGNFGRRTLMTTLGAAAQRYTKVSITPYAINNYKDLFQFASFYRNENDYEEPIAIPTAYPYALVNGAIGIGVGTATHVPPFNLTDLKGGIRSLLNGSPCPLIRPRAVGGGSIEINKENLESLNSKGFGTGFAVATYKWQWDPISGQKLIKITDVPDYINLSKLHFVLKSEIEEGLIFIREDTQKGSPSIEVSVGRNKRIKRISDEELESKVARICRRQLTWNLVFSRKGIAQRLTPMQVLEDALEYAVQANTDRMNSELKKLESDILFEKIKKYLANLIKDDESDSEICKRLSLTSDQLSEFTSRPISRLRSAPKDVTDMLSKVKEIRTNLINPKMAYGKHIGV